MLEISIYARFRKELAMDHRQGAADLSDADFSSFARAIEAKQSIRLDALIAAAQAGRPAAARGMLFASHSGRALVNAAFDLFECDGLYALRCDVEHELGLGEEG
jgi:hypothetical protein